MARLHLGLVRSLLLCTTVHLIAGSHGARSPSYRGPHERCLNSVCLLPFFLIHLYIERCSLTVRPCTTLPVIRARQMPAAPSPAIGRACTACMHTCGRQLNCARVRHMDMDGLPLRECHGCHVRTLVYGPPVCSVGALEAAGTVVTFHASDAKDGASPMHGGVIPSGPYPRGHRVYFEGIPRPRCAVWIDAPNQRSKHCPEHLATNFHQVGGGGCMHGGGSAGGEVVVVVVYYCDQRPGSSKINTGPTALTAKFRSARKKAVLLPRLH